MSEQTAPDHPDRTEASRDEAEATDRLRYGSSFGAGKLTVTLVNLGAEVTAVEPDPQMLGELRQAMPAVRSAPGSAEEIPVPDASLDAVLAGLWNVDDDRVGWVARPAPPTPCWTPSARTPTSWSWTRPNGPGCSPGSATSCAASRRPRGEFTLPMVTVMLRARRR